MTIKIYYQIKLANLVGKNTNVNTVNSISDMLKDDKIKLNDQSETLTGADEVEMEKTEKSKKIIIKKNTNQDS